MDSDDSKHQNIVMTGHDTIMSSLSHRDRHRDYNRQREACNRDLIRAQGPGSGGGHRKAEVCRSFITTTYGNSISGHTTIAPPVEFELATDGTSIMSPVLCHCKLGQDIVP